MIGEIDRRIRRALSGLRLGFRGVITLVRAAGAVQLVQMDGVAGEQLQDAELFQDYGFTSNPPKGTMAIVLPLGGKTSHGIIVATEHGTYRMKNLKSGEVAIYDNQGQHVLLHRDGIKVYTSKKCRIDAEHIEMHANKSWSWDVNGYGQRITWLDGVRWEIKTWQLGATIVPVTLPINPPEGP